ISHYLTLNGGRFPFSDVRMRKAVNLAVDREKIVKYYFRGFGTPTMSFLNSTNPFGRVEKPVFDPVKAKELAKEVLGDKRQTAFCPSTEWRGILTRRFPNLSRRS
ncbi:MAG: ABC transporter substrate-binding protein, partial [Dialister invisus]